MHMQGQLDEYRDAFLFVDTGTPGWHILHLNQAASDRLGEMEQQGSAQQTLCRCGVADWCGALPCRGSIRICAWAAFLGPLLCIRRDFAEQGAASDSVVASTAAHRRAECGMNS